MDLLLNNTDTLYQALLDCDRSYDGHVFVCVTTTGIFCRLSCTARKPKRENVFFAENAANCLEQGYRPCKKCRPLEPVGKPEPIITELMTRLDADPAYVWSEDDIIRLGYNPSTVRKTFRRHIGMTFLELARLKRAGLGVAALSQGAPVIEAQLEAGYESGSGFRDAIQRLLGTPPEAVKNRHLLKARWLETPIGPMLAIADDHALHLLEFAERKGLPNELKKLQTVTGSAVDFADNRILQHVERELNSYFAGQSAIFKTPLALQGSSFTKQVWEALRTIAPGTTCSYAQQAKIIERPSAMRAVARANGQNQIAIIIPCHRVIGSDGSLTGYAGGLWRKDWLLHHEKRYFC